MQTMGIMYIVKRNVTSNTHFSTFSLALTCLFDEINIYPTTLYGFNFQNVDTQLFKSIKE